MQLVLHPFDHRPTVANGIHLQYQFRQASGQNVELELHKGVFPNPKLEGAVRLLGFVKYADMGDYRQQNQAFLRGETPTPDITAHPFTSSVKYGIGLNAEQQVSENARLYGRFGWNEGQHESFAYTEVDQTYAVGGDYAFRAFRRPNDKLGLTFVTNAIKRDHQEYLALGGRGFCSGTAASATREDTVEGYYNLHAWKGVYYDVDGQFIEHPGLQPGPRTRAGRVRSHARRFLSRNNWQSRCWPRSPGWRMYICQMTKT